MIKVLDTLGPLCGCGRITVFLVDELGRTAQACFGCTGRMLKDQRVVAALEARIAELEAPKPRKPHEHPFAGQRVYRLRECTRCHRMYQPTGPRGSTCPGDVCPP